MDTCKRCNKELPINRTVWCCDDCMNTFNKEYRHSIEGRYEGYKRGAKSRKIDFDLTFEQFKSFWQKSCSYCGDNIETIGIDRIDSFQGYNINNTTPCCFTCNMMKRIATTEEFLAHCKKIIAFMC